MSLKVSKETRAAPEVQNPSPPLHLGVAAVDVAVAAVDEAAAVVVGRRVLRRTAESQ